MISLPDLLFILAAYCLGCFTSGFYWVRWRTGQDVRQLGSGSVGARNVGRVLGWSGFVVTLLLDFTKGALVVWLAWKLGVSQPIVVGSMVAVVIGHTWPVQLRFRGGKGVATSLGALLAFDPLLALLLLLVFLACFLALRNFTVAGLLAFVLSPLAGCSSAFGVIEVASLSSLGVVVLLAHHRNIRQEIAGVFQDHAVKEHPMHSDNSPGL